MGFAEMLTGKVREGFSEKVIAHPHVSGIIQVFFLFLYGLFSLTLCLLPASMDEHAPEYCTILRQNTIPL